MFKTKIEDMKKIYMSPTMDVIELKNQQSLLAGSVLNISDTPVGVGDADAAEFTGDDLTFFE